MTASGWIGNIHYAYIHTYIQRQHTNTYNIYKKFEVMLTRCAKAYKLAVPV